MSLFSPSRAALLLVVSLAGACIDDPLADRDEGIPITPEEAEILGIQVWRTAFLSREEIETPTLDLADGPAGAPVRFSGSSTETLPCAVSGSVVTDLFFELEVDDVTGLGFIELDVNQVHQDCASEEEGVTVVLNGDPGITLEMRIVQDQPTVTGLTGSIRGAVDALVGDKIDTCPITIAFAGVEVEGQESAFSLTGNVCDQELDIQVTQPVPATTT